MTIKAKLLYAFLLTIALSLVAIVIIAVQTRSSQPSGQPTKLAVPTPVKTIPPSLQPNNKTPITYNTEKSQQLLAVIKTRPELSPQDQQTRDTIITRVSSQSGVLISGSLFQAFYVAGPNTFEVEILTTDIASAKQAAVNWFLSQGFTDEGICLLPVEFYLDYDVANQLRGKNIILNPLAEDC